MIISPQALQDLHELVTELCRPKSGVGVGGWTGDAEFVNHADSAGDWDGSTDWQIAPAWTEAAILADIGDTERYTELWSFRWAYQTRQILDRLRWVRRAPYHLRHDRGEWVHPPTYAELKAIWDASAWSTPTAWEKLANSYAVHARVLVNAEKNYWYTARAGGPLRDIDSGSGCAYTTDYYLFPTRLGEISDDHDVYADHGTGWTEVTWVKLETVGPATGNHQTVSEPGKIDACPNEPPAELTGDLSYGFWLGGSFKAMAVAKYDVPGGFALVD